MHTQTPGVSKTKTETMNRKTKLMDKTSDFVAMGCFSSNNKKKLGFFIQSENNLKPNHLKECVCVYMFISKTQGQQP